MGASPWDRVVLRNTLVDRFSADELQNLAYDIGIDYDNLAGDTKSARARNLIEYLHRRGQLDTLVGWVQKNRPDIDPQSLTARSATLESGAEPPAPPASGAEPSPAPPAPLLPTPPAYQYVNFDVAFDDLGDDVYTVRVLDSPAGQAEARTRLRADEPPIVAGLKALEAATLDLRAVQAMGERLFAALLPDEVSKLYFATLGRIDRSGRILRLRLRIEPPDLKSLPWETVYDRLRTTFLATRADTTLSRFLPAPTPPAPAPFATTLRVLLLLSSPSGAPPLDVAARRQRLEAALAPLISTGRVRLDVVEQPTSRTILQRVRSDAYHVIHYDGPAHYVSDEGEMVRAGQTLRPDTGYLGLCDEDNSLRLMDEESLALLLADLPGTRLALLAPGSMAAGAMSGPFTRLGERLAQVANLPAVVTLQFPLDDATNGDFMAAFYQSIADGVAVDTALTQARLALVVNHGLTNRAWGAPVLFLRAADGRLFADLRSSA